MGVRFACHGCGKPLNIKTELAGKRGKCPACGLRFRIPAEDQELSIPLDDEQANEERESTSTPHLTPHPNPTAQVDQNLQPVSSASTQTEQATATFDPFEDAQAQWYVRPPSGGRYGPADGPTLQLWINEGRITQDTLLWRDGWAQWRSGDEVIPKWSAEKSPNENYPNVRSTQPNPSETPSTTSLPVPPTGAQQPHKEITLKPLETKPQEAKPHEPYPSLKRRRNSNQRVIIVVCLLVSVLLLAALIAVMLWPRTSDEETRQDIDHRPMLRVATESLVRTSV